MNFGGFVLVLASAATWSIVCFESQSLGRSLDTIGIDLHQEFLGCRSCHLQTNRQLGNLRFEDLLTRIQSQFDAAFDLHNRLLRS